MLIGGPEDTTDLMLPDGTQLGRTKAYRRAREVALAWQQVPTCTPANIYATKQVQELWEIDESRGNRSTL